MPDADVVTEIRAGLPRVSVSVEVVSFNIISVEQVRIRLGLPSASAPILKQLIEGFSSLLPGEINRELHRCKRTEYFSCQDNILILSVPPVVEIVSVGWQELKGGMTPDVEDIEDSNYFVDAKQGYVYLNENLYRQYNKYLVVTYVGGFPLNDDEDVLDFVLDRRLGSALVQACIDQVSVAYQRRKTLGVSSTSQQDTTESLQIDQELPSLMRLHRDFYRYT